MASSIGPTASGVTGGGSSNVSAGGCASETTSTGADGSILKPEEGEGFEVGVKAELFDRRLLATLTYFDITKQNVPVTDPDNLLFSVSSGEQRNRGIELDLIGELAAKMTPQDWIALYEKSKPK